MASARCCRRFLGQCSFSTDGYIYIYNVMGHLLGTQGRSSDAASMFIYMASRDFEKERRGMHVEASCK